MAINIDVLEADKVAEAENLLVDIFTNSDIDCGVGTTIRELVIRPMAVLRATEQAEQTSFFNKLNLFSVAEGGESNSDTIDAVASTYRIKRLPGRPAKGTILAELDNDVTTYIPQGVVFTYGDYSLYLDKTYIITDTSDTTNYTDTEEVSYLKPYILDSSLYAVIPVHTDAGVVDVIPSGTELTYSGTINNVSRYSVLSPISGGSAIETDQELANRILYGVVKGYLSTPLQIRAALSEAFSVRPDNVAVFGVNDAVVNRAINPITGISQGGFLDIYVNVDKSVATNYISAIAESDTDASSSEPRSFSVTLSQKESSGIYDISDIFAVDGTVLSDLAIEYGMYENSHQIKASDARFTAFQKVKISFKASTTESTLPITIVARCMNSIDQIQRFVDSDERRTPGQDTVVKAAIPCFLDIVMSAVSGDINYDEEAMKQAILTKIHNKPIGSDSFTVEDIIDALKPFNVTIKFPVVITGTVLTPNSKMVSSTTTAAYILPATDTAEYSRKAVSFFSDLNSINLVVGTK